VGCTNPVSCHIPVFVDESTQPVSAVNAAWSGRAGESERWLLEVGRREVQRTMWAVGVVMLDVDAEHAFELSPVQNEEPVEALGANGSDKALGDRVRFG
jgi:hypothetical protein